MAGKRPALPLVLSASDLFDGDVVYHDGAGWVRSLAAAYVARDEAGWKRRSPRSRAAAPWRSRSCSPSASARTGP